MQLIFLELLGGGHAQQVVILVGLQLAVHLDAVVVKLVYIVGADGEELTDILVFHTRGVVQVDDGAAQLFVGVRQASVGILQQRVVLQQLFVLHGQLVVERVQFITCHGELAALLDDVQQRQQEAYEQQTDDADGPAQPVVSRAQLLLIRIVDMRHHRRDEP